MAGGGRVEDDQVGDAGALELLHLAEDEDVLHAGHRGGDDVERTGGAQPPPDASQAVVVRYSTSASSGVRVRARSPGGAPPPRR